MRRGGTLRLLPPLGREGEPNRQGAAAVRATVDEATRRLRGPRCTDLPRLEALGLTIPPLVLARTDKVIQ
jgi:hypothetical protein